MKLKLKIQTSIHLRRLDTLFVGQVFHHLPLVDSTNRYAFSILSKSKPPEGTAVSTAYQTAGRGQVGSHWESESGKNICLSIILYPDFLLAQNQFLLNQAASLAVVDTVAKHFAGTKVKWPNDIYVGDKKIAGILIQNTIAGNHLRATVIGIGLNVNQVNFSKNVPNATSFKNLSEKTFDLDELIALLCQSIEQRYLNLKAGKIVPLQTEYLNRLYRFGEAAQFIRPGGQIFTGNICGISPNGRLQIRVEGKVEEFDLKEVKFNL